MGAAFSAALGDGAAAGDTGGGWVIDVVGMGLAATPPHALTSRAIARSRFTTGPYTFRRPETASSAEPAHWEWIAAQRERRTRPWGGAGWVGYATGTQARASAGSRMSVSDTPMPYVMNRPSGTSSMMQLEPCAHRERASRLLRHGADVERARRVDRRPGPEGDGRRRDGHEQREDAATTDRHGDGDLLAGLDLSRLPAIGGDGDVQPPVDGPVHDAARSGFARRVDVADDGERCLLERVPVSTSHLARSRRSKPWCSHHQWCRRAARTSQSCSSASPGLRSTAIRTGCPAEAARRRLSRAQQSCAWVA